MRTEQATVEPQAEFQSQAEAIAKGKGLMQAGASHVSINKITDSDPKPYPSNQDRAAEDAVMKPSSR